MRLGADRGHNGAYEKRPHELMESPHDNTSRLSLPDKFVDYKRNLQARTGSSGLEIYKARSARGQPGP